MTRASACALVLLSVVASGCVAESRAAAQRELRVCADPNNLPFSNEAGEGFENRIAEVVADELDATVSYTWWAQRRGFIRNTLGAGLCDVVPGVPGSFELAQPTRPYYRSTYTFVTRTADSLDITSFDDPRLRDLRIGVQLVGDDYTNTPPAHALANRGLRDNIVGYTLYGDYTQPNPPARIVSAVASGAVDVAVVWGPLAGYFAPRQALPLTIVPVSPQIDLPFLPFVYDIAFAVRRGDDSLRAEIDRALTRRAGEIDAILLEYGVPRAERVRATRPATEVAS